MRKLLLIALVVVAASLAACAEPLKQSTRKIKPCSSPATKLAHVPYLRENPETCAVAVAPFDLSVWIEAPYNSHKTRDVDMVELGCKPISAPADNCQTCGLPGHSNTLMMNFDPTVYPDDITVQKAVLAVWSPNDPQGLNEAIVRGRLNVGDELQSLAREREGVVLCGSTCGAEPTGDGWIFYDVTNFVGRAINERRNSIHFEVSIPCQVPAKNLVTVGVRKNEPQLVVEFK